MGKLNKRGSVLIFLTLGFALLGTFIGFAVDFGRAYLEKARISRLVDAASLAAAKALKGQEGLQQEATRAACDSMLMNDVQVEMSGNSCVSVEGARITTELNFFERDVVGGPPIWHVEVTGREAVSTTFLRFLGWMVPGDYSTINVTAVAQAAPERPIDLMLVLDRSGSMNELDGANQRKIVSLKNAVNAFLSLSDTFTSSDRIGMVSFASRGCGNTATGLDSTSTNCVPDASMQSADDAQLGTLRNRVNGLCGGGTNDCLGGTNTMESLQVARAPLANAFNEVDRATTRKAVLLVTDGQPTFLTRTSDAACKTNPLTGSAFPSGSNGNTNAGGGPFNGGCKQGLPGVTSSTQARYMYRQPLSSTANDCLVGISGNYTSTACPGSIQGGSDTTANDTLYQNVITCTRSLSGCATNGAMYEANLTRNCGYDNAGCDAGGRHDVVFYAIAIGAVDNTRPQSSLDNNAKCLLARMANANDILNAATGAIENMTTVCNNLPSTIDDDNHAYLKVGCPGGNCIVNASQQIGKVFTIDSNGNVEAQLRMVFAEIAALLKLRLVL